MDGTLKRFEEIEWKLAKLRIDLNEHSALVRNLATKNDIQSLKTDVGKIKTDIETKERNWGLFRWTIGCLAICWIWCYVITKLAQ